MPEGTVLDDLDIDHGNGMLARAAYGVFDRTREVEMIPNNPRYGFIPALPATTTPDVLARFGRVLKPGEAASPEEWLAILDACFPPVDRGAAWSRISGPIAVAANTHENWFVPEAVRLELPARPADVRIVVGDGTTAIAWSHRKGDRAYRVWRLRDGVETLLGETSGTTYPLDDVQPDDRFAASAVTAATEKVAGTLHLHDFLLYSTRESRRSAWIDIRGQKIERTRIGEGFHAPAENVLTAERRCAECAAVEDLASPTIAPDDPHAAVKREVTEAIIGWRHAIEREDISGILACYDPRYCEPDGRTAESVGVAFRSLFWRYLEERAGSVALDWGTVYAWRNPVLRVLVRGWPVVGADRVEVDTVATLLAGGGPEMEPSDMFAHPWDRKTDLRMTWRRGTDGVWRILATTPAFLRMEDVAIFRWCYQGW